MISPASSATPVTLSCQQKRANWVGVAGGSDDRVPAFEELRDQPGADITGCADDQYAH